jgi:hypothetical protein
MEASESSADSPANRAPVLAHITLSSDLGFDQYSARVFQVTIDLYLLPTKKSLAKSLVQRCGIPYDNPRREELRDIVCMTNGELAFPSDGGLP